MEIDIILSELEQNCGYFPRDAVEEAIRQKEEITPYLLRSLEEVCAGHVKPDEDEAYFLHIYAMYLLAQFRDKRAYPLVMQICTFPIEKLDLMLGDVVTEGLPHIIASVFDGDTQPIKSVIENTSADEYVRSSALRSLTILFYEGILERTEVIAYFAELFRGKLEEEYSYIWDSLASEAVNLHATTLANDIHNAYERDLVWPGDMHPDEVDRVFAMNEESVIERSRKWHSGLIDDTISELQSWACFEPDQSSSHTETETFNELPLKQSSSSIVRSEPKIGRNEPCPCGSGKKYKRCCGK